MTQPQDADEKLSAEAAIYADKLFKCEPPCDSYGICSNCSERNVFQAGYNFGRRSRDEYVKRLEAVVIQARKAMDTLTELQMMSAYDLEKPIVALDALKEAKGGEA